MDPGSTPGGFSSAIDRIRWRSSWAIFGRPERRRESKRQYQRKPARCQPTTVSGFTTTSTLAHLDHQRRRPSQKRRSQRLTRGLGFLRLRTPTCLPEGDELQSEVMSRAEEGTEPRKRRQKKPDHGSSLHDTVERKTGSCKWLILRSNQILRTHSE